MIFTSKEQLLYFMNKGEIKMSNQDASFFSTIYGLVYRNKQITSNQDQLFNKLLVKHKNQLKRKGLVASQLCELPWAKANIVASQEDFAKANIKLVDGVLYLRTPFNKKFVSELNGINSNPFLWSTGGRNYQAQFSTRALKIAVNTAQKHFKTIAFCPVLTELVKQVPPITGVFWRPTLVKANTGYYIAGSNSVLIDKIQDIELKEDPITYFQLSKLGVNISNELIGEDKFAKFAANHYNELSINSASNIDTPVQELGDWLNKLNINKVVIGREPTYFKNRRIGYAIKRILAEKGIKCVTHIEHSINEETVMIHFIDYGESSTQNVVKRILIRESKPINA